MAYSWFIFFRPDVVPAWLVDLRAAVGSPCSVTLPIAPGQQKRLTRPQDLRRFRVAS
jgi:hypothetical protein